MFRIFSLFLDFKVLGLVSYFYGYFILPTDWLELLFINWDWPDRTAGTVFPLKIKPHDDEDDDGIHINFKMYKIYFGVVALVSLNKSI